VLHTVRVGDNLGSVAQHYGIGAADLIAANLHRRWSFLDTLQPGEVLRVPYVPQSGSIGAGVFPSTQAAASAQQYATNLKNSYTQQGNEYILNTAQATAGVDFQGLDFSATIAALARGDVPGAIDAADTAIVAYASLSVPAAGLIVSAFVEGIEALWSTQPSPCTIAGCESTFNMSACDHWPDGNPFLWSSIAATLLPALPPAQPYHFSGGPDSGPSNLIDWGSYDWQDSTPLDPTKPGGPGSFEQGLQLAMMTLWDSLVTAPLICNTLKNAGQSGDIMLNSSTREQIWSMLIANAGALVPVFLAAWNVDHTLGTVTTNVPCTQANCAASGGTWIASDHSCGSGGVAVTCTTKAPAPPRKISYTVGTSTYENPLSVAFEGLAQLSNLPAGATLSLLVNSGPPGHGAINAAAAAVSSSSSSSSSAGTVVLVGGGLVAAAAAAWALTGHSFSWEAIKAVFKHAGGSHDDKH